MESPTELANYALGPYGTTEMAVSQNKTPSTLSRLRLFVVVYKACLQPLLNNAQIVFLGCFRRESCKVVPKVSRHGVLRLEER